MKKNVLSLSIAAMFGGLGWPRQQQNHPSDSPTVMLPSDPNPSSLLVPYFNAQHGNMTVFHVANTDTVTGKPVQVRFRSASKSDDILDFREFLAPGDAWSLVPPTSTMAACTLPRGCIDLQRMGRAFRTERLNG